MIGLLAVDGNDRQPHSAFRRPCIQTGEVPVPDLPPQRLDMLPLLELRVEAPDELSNLSGQAGGRRALEVPCALCGARETRRLYTKYGWGIERCRRCSLVYANPRAPESAILERYNAEYFWNEYLPAAGAPGGEIDDAVLDGRHGAIIQMIRREAPDGRRMLEVGSGAGLFLHAAARPGGIRRAWSFRPRVRPLRAIASGSTSAPSGRRP